MSLETIVAAVSAVLGGALAWWITHGIDQARLQDLQAKFSQYQAQVQADNTTAQRAADEALQAEFNARKAAEVTNAEVRQSLESQVADAQRDRDFATRLLQRAQNARTTAAGSEVPGTFDRPGTAPDSSAPADRPATNLIRLTADSATECRDAIQRLAGLQIELIPQLNKN